MNDLCSLRQGHGGVEGELIDPRLFLDVEVVVGKHASGEERAGKRVPVRNVGRCVRRDLDVRRDGGEVVGICHKRPEVVGGVISCIEQRCIVGHERRRENFVGPSAVVRIGYGYV